MSLTYTDIFCGFGGSSIGLQNAGLQLQLAANHWDKALLTAPSPVPRGWGLVLEVVLVEELRRRLLEGRIALPRLGEVRRRDGAMPYVVVDAEGEEVEPVSAFLLDLTLSDASPLTLRSYGHDLLRWWRLLSVLEVLWDKATRAEVDVLVGWLRSARNPQHARAEATPGTVNLRTGKRTLSAGYASATINHALSVLSTFYAFHLHFGRGPLSNPVPVDAARRRALAHRGPMQPRPEHHRGSLRQKRSQRLPRSIPDALWDERFATLRNDRDRALLAFYVSSGARASELLGLHGEHVDWAGQRLWVISKGSRLLEPVPGSPEAFRYLGRYFDQHGTPAVDAPVWRTLRGEPRPLTYWAMRRVLQRANEVLGTNWTLHDTRHTTATRMADDPQITLPEVQAVMRHRHLATTQQYLPVRVEDLHDKLHEHYARPRPQTRFAPGYDAEDFRTVFGG
jgi:integrase